MYKAAIIGDRGSALGFMALGFSVLEAEDAAAAKDLLHRAAKSGEYAVLFLTENYAEELAEDIARGAAKEEDCVYIMKEQLRKLMEQEKGGER